MAQDSLDLPPDADSFADLGELLNPPVAPAPCNTSASTAPQHLLPLLQDTAVLLGEIIRADLTGATEAVENGTVLIRGVGAAWDGEKTSQTIVPASSPGAHASLAAYTLQAGNTITSSDLVTDGRFNDDFLRRLAVRSALCIPVRPHDTTIGTLEFYRLRKQAFAPEDVQFVEVVSRQLGVLVRQIQNEQTDRTKQQHPRKRSEASRRGAELRTSPRRKYPYRQLIAPIVGAKVPSREDFFPVWCKDLSGGGFSIYMENPPTFHNLIVALGVSPHVKFYRAEAMHVQPIEYEGRRVFLVGCRLVTRVYL